MSDEPYMNGKGTIDETRRLVDEMWDKLWLAIAGGFSLSIAATMVIMSIIENSWGTLPVVIILVLVGLALGRPWAKAAHALGKHTARMKVETAKRGRGWARS
jgi:hypothetical protein